MANLFKNKRILVVVAHPDDELLGIGGTLNLLSKSDNEIKVVILGEGLTSRADERNATVWEQQLNQHQNNIKSAKRIIGYQHIGIYKLPDNRFDSVDLLDIIKIVEKEKEAFDPEIIFTHHGGDLNIDHQRTFEAVMTAFRPLEGETTEAIITFETPSGTEWRASTDPRHFIPNFFIEISEENINAKIEAMECYEFEKREHPHPRSPKALKITSEQRGIMIGCKYAEAFCCVRNVIKM